MEIKDRNDFLDYILSELKKDFDELGLAAVASSDRKEKVRLSNARTNKVKAMAEIMAMKYDPKYISLSPEEKKKGLAKMMQAYREKEDRDKVRTQDKIEKKLLITYKTYNGGKTRKTTNLLKHFEDMARQSAPTDRRKKRRLKVSL